MALYEIIQFSKLFAQIKGKTKKWFSPKIFEKFAVVLER